MKSKFWQNVFQQFAILPLPASLDCEDYDMAFLLKSVGEMATLLCRRISALEADNVGLRSALAHMENVYDVMGEKIR